MSMLKDTWIFLTDPENRTVLSWLGGGLVVVCGGLWTVVTFVLGRKKPPPDKPPRPSTQRAETGGMVAGEDITVRQSTGLNGTSVVLLVLALAGAAVLIAANTGDRTATVTGCGTATTGNVSDSTVKIDC
jgi:hypothetical protein